MALQGAAIYFINIHMCMKNITTRCSLFVNIHMCIKNYTKRCSHLFTNHSAVLGRTHGHRQMDTQQATKDSWQAIQFICTICPFCNTSVGKANVTLLFPRGRWSILAKTNQNQKITILLTT